MSDEHDRYSDDVGAYLLAALDDDEARAFERHTSTCELCRRELERLRVSVEALPRSVEPVTPPIELRRSLMRAVRAEAQGADAALSPRRTAAERLGLGALFVRPLRQAVTLAAALVLIVGIAAGLGITHLTQSNGSQVLSASVDRALAPRAHASLEEFRGGGAVLRVRGLQPPPAGRVYELWTKRGRAVVPTAIFSTDRRGDGVAAVARSLAGARAVLVTQEPAGGSPAPTGAQLISVKT